MSIFREEIKRQETVVHERRHLSAQIEGFDVFIELADGISSTHVTMAPIDYGSLRLGILSLHPKSVADLERFAEMAPTLLRAIATGLREAGLDDLRPTYEREHEAFLAEMRRERDA